VLIFRPTDEKKAPGGYLMALGELCYLLLEHHVRHKLDDARSLYVTMLRCHSGDPGAKYGFAFLDASPKPRPSADQLPSIFLFQAHGKI
jgi:hypothetical protein